MGIVAHYGVFDVCKKLIVQQHRLCKSVGWFDRLGDANIQAQDDEMMRLMEDVRKRELHAATLRLYDAMESVMVEVHTTKV